MLMTQHLLSLNAMDIITEKKRFVKCFILCFKKIPNGMK